METGKKIEESGHKKNSLDGASLHQKKTLVKKILFLKHFSGHFISF
jgi:hypothetical protein